MAEKGRKPAAAAWGSAARHQGRGGTSRANLAVRTGAWKGELVGGGDGWWVKGRGRARRRPTPPPPSTHRLFLPTTPPTTVSGSVTAPQMAAMATMVPAGRAWVEPCAAATELATQNADPRGTAATPAVSSTLRTQCTPPICL